MDAVVIPQGNIPNSALCLAFLEQNHQRQAVYMVLCATSSPLKQLGAIPDLQGP